METQIYRRYCRVARRQRICYSIMVPYLIPCDKYSLTLLQYILKSVRTFFKTAKTALHNFTLYTRRLDYLYSSSRGICFKYEKKKWTACFFIKKYFNNNITFTLLQNTLTPVWSFCRITKFAIHNLTLLFTLTYQLTIQPYWLEILLERTIPYGFVLIHKENIQWCFETNLFYRKGFAVWTKHILRIR